MGAPYLAFAGAWTGGGWLLRTVLLGFHSCLVVCNLLPICSCPKQTSTCNRSDNQSSPTLLLFCSDLYVSIFVLCMHHKVEIDVKMHELYILYYYGSGFFKFFPYYGGDRLVIILMSANINCWLHATGNDLAAGVTVVTSCIMNLCVKSN